MALYEFANIHVFDNSPRAERGLEQPNPAILSHPVGLSQTSHVENNRDANWDGIQATNVDVEEFIDPGFRYLDEGMKNYWSDLRVPTKDSSRFVKVKIAGAAKGIQIWADDLKNGRVVLPVLSISRGSHTWNAQKFSPPYINLRGKFTSRDRRKIIKDYRPVPYNITYTLTLWAEHKRDAENAIYQIMVRFNPLALFKVSDGHWSGNIEMHLGDIVDVSDKEVAADQYAKVRYEIPITAEAWLALPSQVTSTVLGHVNRIREKVGGVDRINQLF